MPHTQEASILEKKSEQNSFSVELLWPFFPPFVEDGGWVGGRKTSACARKSLLSQMSSCESKLFITEKLLLKKFSKHKYLRARKCCIWRMPKEEAKDVRMWRSSSVAIYPREKKVETFLVSNLCHIEGFCVTTVQETVRGKMRQHSHHNFYFQEFSAPSSSPSSVPLQWFWHWNKSRRKLRSGSTLKTLAHTRVRSVVRRALHKYWKKIWNNKNIRCLILISSYFSLRKAGEAGGQRGRERRGKRLEVWVEFFQFFLSVSGSFFASAYIFLFANIKTQGGRWGGVGVGREWEDISTFSVRNMNTQWQTYHRGSGGEGKKEKKKFIKT